MRAHFLQTSTKATLSVKLLNRCFILLVYSIFRGYVYSVLNNFFLVFTVGTGKYRYFAIAQKFLLLFLCSLPTMGGIHNLR